MSQMPSDPASDLFDRLCDRLEALKGADAPDRRRTVALVHGEASVDWFASFADAARHAREHLAPETYAIGDPTAEPDYVPMVFVRQPMAS
jgi:hypothetical protein